MSNRERAFIQKIFIALFALFIGFVIGILFGVNAGRTPKKLYAVVSNDLDLETIDRMTSVNYPKKQMRYEDNPKMFGIIKKGTIVETGNLVKGEMRGIQISAYVSKDDIRFLGDATSLKSYLNNNDLFYSSHKTSKGVTRNNRIHLEERNNSQQ